MNPETAAAFSLLSAEAVRTRAQHMLALGLDDKLPNFRVDLSLLDATAERVLAVTRQAYPSLDIPFHSRWRHFVVDGDDRFAALARQGIVARCRRPRARRIRSRHRQRLSRCRRGQRNGVIAIPSPARPSAAPRDWRWPASTCSRAARFRPIPRTRLRVDAAVLAQLERRATGGRLSGHVGQSAGRPRWPRRLAAVARRAGRRQFRRIRAKRHAAARRPVRSSRGLGRRRHDRRAGHPVRIAARTRADLAVAHVARRHSARRLLAASVDDDVRRHQRHRAAAQAVAMAGLFADRAAATRGH